MPSNVRKSVVNDVSRTPAAKVAKNRYLVLEGKIRASDGPHTEVSLSAQSRFLQKAVTSPFQQHSASRQDEYGRVPEAATIFPDTRVNPVQAQKNESTNIEETVMLRNDLESKVFPLET